MKKGYLIVIDGLDGTGKQTQAEMIYEFLQINNIKSKLISFPVYDSPTGNIVKNYLRGHMDLSTIKWYPGNQFDIKLREGLLYSYDRMINMYKKDSNGKSIVDYYDEGYVIICDRYIQSNILYMTLDLDEWDYIYYISQIEKVEYVMMNLPEPDLTFFLQMSPEESINLITKRGMELDINENIEKLTKVYDSMMRYKKYCEESSDIRKNNTQFINCVDEQGQLKSKKIIFNLLLNHILKEVQI